MKNISRILQGDLKVNDCLGDQSTDVTTTLKHARFYIVRGEYEDFFLLGMQCSLVEFYNLSSTTRWRQSVPLKV